MSALARRYAKAALEALADSSGGDAALTAGRADTLAANMKRFVALYAQSDALQELLRNPLLKATRPQALEKLLTKLELDAVAHKLITLLAQNNRMHILTAVSEQIELLADLRVDRVRAHVRAAVMPSAAQTQRIAETLQRRLGKSVLVTVSVAPELLAGLVCQVGDLTFDSSLKCQLAILKERLGAHGASS